jgi:RNA polymerase sigma factor (sigma-70 family)
MGANPASEASSGASFAHERFTAAFITHHQAIKAYLSFRTRDATLADELTEATFEFAWRRINEMPEEPATRGWLYVIAKRMLSNHWRDAAPQHNLISKISVAYVCESTSSTIEDELAVDALESLSPRERQALQLIYWDDLRHIEAAAVVGCSLNAFDILLHRARKHMLARLTSRPVEPDQSTSL